MKKSVFSNEGEINGALGTVTVNERIKLKTGDSIAITSKTPANQETTVQTVFPSTTGLCNRQIANYFSGYTVP